MLANIYNLLSPGVVGIKRNIPALFLSTLSDIKEKQIKISENYINYVKVGKGTHYVLCLPGAVGSIYAHFKKQVEGFNRQKLTIVAWDPPGYGKSRPPEKDFSKNIFEKESEDAFKFMQALNIPKYSLLAWSGGSVTAMIHAAKYQNAVQKLVIFGGFSFVSSEDAKEVEKCKDIKQWSNGLRNAMIGEYGTELATKYCYEWMSGLLKFSKSNDGKLCCDLLGDIKCPTFILHGEKDPFINKDNAFYLHSHIKGSQIFIYPEGTHSIHFKYADDFNKRVQEFLTI